MALRKVAETAQNTSEELIQPAKTGSMGVNGANLQHILSRLTMMYPDPIKATVRETVSNAIDATVKVPSADRKPIEIEIGQFDNNLTVRDYGVGMSPTEVEDNFLTYGSSTKSFDFETVGAFGLGAKAPLSYCSEFSVTTTKAGITTAFKLSYTDKGFIFSIMYSKKTGRENGTTVVIPFEVKDRYSFETHVNQYQQDSFDAPIVVNGEKSRGNWFCEVDTFLLDEDTQTVGRVWVDLKKTVWRDMRHGYWLAGYRYNSPYGGNRYYYNDKQNVLFELKPGVVDYTSSRDDISQNSRSEKLEKRVKEYLESDEFKTTILKCAEKELDEKSYFKWVNNFLIYSNTGELTPISDSFPKLKKYVDYTSDESSDGYGFVVFRNCGGKNSRPSYSSPWVYVSELSTQDIAAKWDEVKDSHSILKAVMHLISRGNSQSIDFVSFVTGVDKDNLNKVLRSRAGYSRWKQQEYSQQNGLVFFLKNSVGTLQREVTELLFDNVEELTADEFITQSRKSSHTSERPEAKTTKEVFIKTEAISKPGKFSFERGFVSGEHSQYSAQSILEDDVLVIVSNNLQNANKVLFALENEGAYDESMTAIWTDSIAWNTLRFLTDSDKVFFSHPNLELIKSAKARDYAKNNTKFSDTRLKKTQELASDEALSVLFKSATDYYGIQYSDDKIVQEITGVEMTDPVMSNGVDPAVAWGKVKDSFTPETFKKLKALAHNQNIVAKVLRGLQGFEKSVAIVNTLADFETDDVDLSGQTF